MDNRHIVIFDGVCNFCNGAVKFIIRRDPNELFAFTPMQSQLAKDLMDKYAIHNPGIDTFLLIKNERCYVFSDAALEISKDLTGYWYLFNIFSLLPSTFRDFFYRLFARNRFRLFGRTSTCMVPDDKLRSRFVGLEK